jgi:hypothetical protein
MAAFVSGQSVGQCLQTSQKDIQTIFGVLGRHILYGHHSLKQREWARSDEILHSLGLVVDAECDLNVM